MPKKQLKGTIISNKMDKTVVVKVEFTKTHPKYKKRYKVFNKYKADVKNSKNYDIGDEVVIEESKPISKDKKWRVLGDRKQGK